MTNANNADCASSPRTLFQFGIEITQHEGLECRTLLRYRRTQSRQVQQPALPSQTNTEYPSDYPRNPAMWRFLGFCVGAIVGLFS